jgi:hypothetical protein
MVAQDITLVRKSGKQTRFEEPINPSAKTLWWIVPDVGRNRVPLTCQFRPEHTGKFTPEMQNFVFNLNRSDNEIRDRLAFQGYRDTFNTRGKVRDHYNAITKEGDPSDLPTVEYNIGFAGNVISGIEIVSDGSIGIRAGVKVLKIETIDVNNPLPCGVSYKTHPWLIHHEIICLYEKRNPFPQMGGKDIEPYLPCFTPLWSRAPLYIEMSKLKKVTDVPNPYNPEWSWNICS